jgi:hypothetical protein
MNGSTEKKLGEAAMTVAIQRGYAELSPGCFLYDTKTLIEHQKTLPETDTGKNTDYTKAPFWIVLLPERTVSPCDSYTDVLDFMDSEEVQE